MTPDNKVTLSVLTEEEGLHKASPCSPCPFLSTPYGESPFRQSRIPLFSYKEKLVRIPLFVRRELPTI